MSTPHTLALPDGVLATSIATSRGEFATHVARADQPRGHVLLVHGWTGSKEDFTPVLPLLAAAGYDATAYDQRGHWQTSPGEHPDYSLAGFAADAAALAATLTAGGPVHLLGHSFGGLVVQRAVVDHRDQWATLSLLCTGPAALGISPTRPLDQLVAAIDAGMAMDDIHRHRRGAALGTETPEIEQFLLDRFVATDRAAMRATSQLLIDAPDIVDEVRASGIASWVARGQHDDAWPFDVQEAMANRLGTEVSVVRGAHSPAIEAPEPLVQAWTAWLSAIG